MNTSLKCAFATLLVTGTASGLFAAQYLATSIRESALAVRSHALEKVLSGASSTAVRSSNWTHAAIASHVNIKAAFSPLPNPAPSGTGGTGTR